MVKILAEQAVSATNPTVSGKSVGFDRSVNYQQSGGVSGIESAFNNAAAGAQAAGAIGANILTDMSIANARSRGQQLGHDQPGMDLIPAFTAADKNFTQAYEQEEARTVNFNGQQYLNEAASIVHQDPTPANLAAYQAKSQQTIQELLNTTSKANRNDVQRSLEGSYQSHFLTLSGAVETRNKQILSDNFKASSTQNNDDMYTAGYQKNYARLTDLYHSQVKNINSNQSMNIVSRDVAESMKTTSKIQYGVSKNIADLLEAEREGKGDEFLAEFSKYEMAGFTAVEKEAVGSELYKHIHADRVLRSGQQQIEYTHARLSIENSEMTPESMATWRQKLSGEQYASIELEYARKQNEIIETGNGIIGINGGSNSAFALSQMQDSKFNKAFVKMANESHISEDPILNAAYVAGSINRKNPIMTKTLEQSIAYGGPEEALSAASAVTYLLNQNSGVAVQDMDKQSRSMGSLYQLYSTDKTISPQEALDRARQQVLKQDPLTRETRIDLLNTKLSQTGVSTTSIKSTISKLLSENGPFKRNFLGYDATSIPDEATGAYLNALTSYSLNGLDFKSSQENAANDVATAYPGTHVNGRPERMKYADMMPYGDDVGKNRASIRESIAVVAARNLAARQASQSVVQKLDWDGKTLKVNDIPREVNVKADYFTDLHKGKAWAMYYTDDKGLQVNLTDTDPRAPNGVARWIPAPIGNSQ